MIRTGLFSVIVPTFCRKWHSCVQTVFTAVFSVSTLVNCLWFKWSQSSLFSWRDVSCQFFCFGRSVVLDRLLSDYWTFLMVMLFILVCLNVGTRPDLRWCYIRLSRNLRQTSDLWFGDIQCHIDSIWFDIFLLCAVFKLLQTNSRQSCSQPAPNWNPSNQVSLQDLNWNTSTVRTSLTFTVMNLIFKEHFLKYIYCIVMWLVLTFI